MSKVFRVMKADNVDQNLPKTGNDSCCLGVRDNEITLDAEGNVEPGTQRGMSVNDSVEAIPPTLLPPQYARYVEGPGGKKSHRVWTTGQGAFRDGPFAPRLQLACEDVHYGLVEPDSRMHHSQFRQALSDTCTKWVIVDPI